METAVVTARNAREMQLAAAEFLNRYRNEEVVVVAPSLSVAADVVQLALGEAQAVFGWQRTTFDQLVSQLALPLVAAQRRTPVSGLALRALCARVVHHHETDLGRFASVGDRPGFAVALAESFTELSLAGVTVASLAGADADLARLYGAYLQELDQCGLVDRGQMIELATKTTKENKLSLMSLDRPILFLDVVLRNEREEALVAALAERAPCVHLVTSVSDPVSIDIACRALSCEASHVLNASLNESLDAVRERTFNPDSEQEVPEQECVRVFSAPGEHREAIEIVRRIYQCAKQGTPFDRIAVLMRNPNHHTGPLQEAFARGEVPAHFARATTRPDPHGRALLALIACKLERLSARAFSEYLSLCVVPDDVDGAPPPATALWMPPADTHVTYRDALSEEDEYEEELHANWDDELFEDDEASTFTGTLRAPRRWEKLIVNASVIGGLDRWTARLDGLEAALQLELSSTEDSVHRARAPKQLADLRALREFAMPLLTQLDALPEAATWGEWIRLLTELATRALSQPTRVVEALAELTPMAPIGPVTLTEVELVISRRLTELRFREKSDVSGKVWVSTIEEARGRAFDVVFLPGLAEKMFPEKVMEDPILLDATRRTLEAKGLQTNVDRIAEERLQLHMGQYAAEKKLFLSWPSVHTDRGRPRVASFYALEVLRALTGTLPTFRQLSAMAEQDGKEGDEKRYRTSLRWPAPRLPEHAIDDVEFDLSVLRDYMIDRAETETGAARYLMDVNVHLARSLRAREQRWNKGKFTRADGLVGPGTTAVEQVHLHRLAERPYSATALQRYASCPYKFFIMSVLSLSPRQVAVAIDELDPLQRGKLIHDVQFELLSALKAAELLPIATNEALGQATRILDEVLPKIAAEHHAELAPAIERVWEDGIDAIRSDLREWLYRMHQDGGGWIPSHFELAFGLRKHFGHVDSQKRDQASTDAPVLLDCGIQLRGAIDLVETSDSSLLGHLHSSEEDVVLSEVKTVLRAVDHKTGRASAPDRFVINGGRTLQPLLYALALEKLFPNETVVSGGLHYATRRGEFETRWVPLDPVARRAAEVLATSLTLALEHGFFPAFPLPEKKGWGRATTGGCSYCEVAAICGPHEVERTRTKDKRWLKQLNVLRSQR